MIFSGQDWIIKLLSGEYPVHQAIAIRGIVAMVILLGFIACSGKLEGLPLHANDESGNVFVPVAPEVEP